MSKVDYFVQWAQIAGDQIALFRINENSVIIVVTDVADEDRFLADGQEPALERRNLFEIHNKWVIGVMGGWRTGRLTATQAG